MNDRAETKRRAFAAASTEIEATCNRLALSRQDYLELLAELTAVAAFNGLETLPGWEYRARLTLEAIVEEARTVACPAGRTDRAGWRPRQFWG
ncbi:hypothetical protein [Asaia platycodi]|uniref:hypothetical protein n=1 Tax=Asaia platycodi TaxID=610243 RepID=UPI000472323B|nr:hypothetical protein [Asaia platycodi]